MIFSTYAQAEIVIDPAAFPDDTDLTHAYPGVTLIANTNLITEYPHVTNFTHLTNPTQFVMRYGTAGSTHSSWTYIKQQFFSVLFEAHFAAATDSVSIEMKEGSPAGITSTGVLEAYDEAGNLLDTASTPLGNTIAYITLSIDRPSADIRFIRAYGAHDFHYAGAFIAKFSFKEWAPTLSVSPPSGSYASTQSFDLTLILRALGVSVVRGSALLDGSDITAALTGCSVHGNLVSGGQTFRCPSLSGSQLGVGTHTLDVSFDLSDGTTVQDAATWEVLENTEP